MKENQIWDFDGTFTDVEEDTRDWQGKYPIICSEILGVNPKSILPLYNKIKDDLKNHPEKGFVIAGYDALPANSDPYIRCQAAIQGVLRDRLEGRTSLKFELPVDETRFLIDAYLKTNDASNDELHFREGAKEILQDARKKYNIVIVSNSSEEKVLSGLEKISASDIPVYGNAKKLFIDKSMQAASKNIELPGFPREPLLGRKNYFDILDNLSSKEGFNKKNTTVIGDIYELDLALPDFLGYKVIQINNGSAPIHEKNYMGKNFVENLSELRKLIL